LYFKSENRVQIKYNNNNNDDNNNTAPINKAGYKCMILARDPLERGYLERRGYGKIILKCILEKQPATMWPESKLSESRLIGDPRSSAFKFLLLYLWSIDVHVRRPRSCFLMFSPMFSSGKRMSDRWKPKYERPYCYAPVLWVLVVAE
jgi:hypothetical protein